MPARRQTSSEPAPSVLVLGAELDLRSVTSHRWHEVPEELNVVDFDVLLLDYTPFGDHDYSDSINPERLPPRAQLIRHFFTQESVTIVIGAPDQIFGPDTWRVRVDEFLPVRPETRQESGRRYTVDRYEGQLEPYFECVDRWEWYCTNSTRMNEPAFDQISETLAVDANVAVPRVEALASNVKDELVAFEMRIELWETTGDRFAPNDLLRTSGRLLWLPAPTRCSSKDAILRLLPSIGIRAESPPPPWAGDYSLPRQADAAQCARDLEGQIAELQRGLDQARQRLDEEARFVKLLHEQGELLEEVVRDTLRQLGADVTDPHTPGGNDGALRGPAGRSAVLEIKGKTGACGVRDMRQLRDWVTQAETADPDAEVKGIFVANALCDTSPDERDESFDVNAVKRARRWDLALLTTRQLYQALSADQRDALDRDKFWDAVFAADGLVELPEPD